MRVRTTRSNWASPAERTRRTRKGGRASKAKLNDGVTKVVLALTPIKTVKWRGRVVDAEGFRGLTAGAAKLQAHLGDELLLGRRFLEAKRTLAADAALEDNLVLPAGATLSGRVVTDAGVVRSRYVVAVPEGVKPLEGRDTPGGVVVPISPDGRFLLRELPPGRWRVRAWTNPHWVTVETGKTDVVLPD